MKKIIEILKFEWVDKWWGDKFERTPYLTPCIVLFTITSGAITGANTFAKSALDMNMNNNILEVFALATIIMFGIVVLESIIASKIWWVPFVRSLIMAVLMALAFAIGCAGSIIILIIIGIVVLLIIAGAVLGGMTGSSASAGGPLGGNSGSSSEEQKYFNDESGRRVDLEDAGAGDYYGSDGNKYESTFGGGVRRKE